MRVDWKWIERQNRSALLRMLGFVFILAVLAFIVIYLPGCADSSITKEYNLDQIAGNCAGGGDSQTITLQDGSQIKVPCGSNVVVLNISDLESGSTTKGEQTVRPESSIPIAYNQRIEQTEKAEASGSTSSTSGETSAEMESKDDKKKDGDNSGGEEVEEYTLQDGDPPVHHFNPESWDGKGTSIVLSEDAPAMESVSVDGVDFIVHKTGLDKGRVVWTEPTYGKAHIHGAVVMKSKDGKMWKFKVDDKYTEF